MRTQSHEIDKEEKEVEGEEGEVNLGRRQCVWMGERGSERQWRGGGFLGGLDSSLT